MKEALRSSGVVAADAFGAQYEAELLAGRDPWRSLRELREAVPEIAVQATIAGAGLLRLAPVADDVVELFIRLATQAGVALFRVHDALNDIRNVEFAIGRVRAEGAVAHGQVFYSQGPPYTMEYWRKLAADLVALGCEALVVDDVGWQLEPRAAADLAQDLEKSAQVPVVVTTAGSVSALHMLSGLRASFPDAEQDGSLGRFFEEFAQVRTDLGYPPLSAAASAVIGAQALMNVSEGSRYRTATHELREYLHGLYGRPPADPDAELRRQVLGHDAPLSVRPAEVIDPAVPAAEAELKRLGVSPDPELVVSFCLFPDATRALLRQRSGKAERDNQAGQREQPESRADGSTAAEQATAASAQPGAAPAAASPPAQAAAGGEFEVEVEGEVFRVRVSSTGASVSSAAAAAPAAASPAAPAASGTAIVAPMQGLLVKINVNTGDEVKLGDVVAVLEAMKMQNDIVSTVAGRVSAVAAKQGEVVTPNQPLVYVG